MWDIHQRNLTVSFLMESLACIYTVDLYPGTAILAPERRHQEVSIPPIEWVPLVSGISDSKLTYTLLSEMMSNEVLLLDSCRAELKRAH